MTVREVSDQAAWDEMVQTNHGHPLQLWGWGELKSRHNWTAHRLVVEEQGRVIGGAQLLRRRLPGPFGSLIYVPRGPIGDTTKVLPQLTGHLKNKHRATHIAVEPQQVETLQLAGWRSVAKAALLPRTVILDLTRTEDELLADMTKKTRQYIRKSAGSGVNVRLAGQDDIAACLDIYRQTANRANFSLHDDQYYFDLNQTMGKSSQIFVAEADSQVVAFLWLIATPQIAFELYGGMNDQGQRLRANYALKWQAVQLMRQNGVKQYDLNGLLNDGVSKFKQGFASTETQLAGTYDYPLSGWYWVWRAVFPAIKRGLQAVASLRK